MSVDAVFDAEIVIAGYAKTMKLFGRAALVAVLEPVGRVSTQTIVAGRGVLEQANGFGDPMVEFTVNVLGPPAITGMPGLLRYEPGFSLDLLVDLALPLGEYDESSAVNLGQNRWYGRIGAPIVWQLGPWVPGRRTTLELLPSVWLFGDNHDFSGGRLETDPMVQVEGHLTRDFTTTFWGSLDAAWLAGGASTIDGGEKGESLDNLSFGFTLGYQLNDNTQLTAGYSSSVNDDAPQDLRMDVFRISLVYGWHRIIEGMGRLGEGG